MNFATQDLQFAATVRDLAVQVRAELWQKERQRFLAAQDKFEPAEPDDLSVPIHERLNAQGRAQFEADRARERQEAELWDKWRAENPFDKFVAQALEMITDTAAVIARLRSPS